MAARIRMDGLAAFRAELKNLPTDLAAEAAPIVESFANLARNEIRSGYPVGPTGNLRDRVQVSSSMRSGKAAAIVRSLAPHSALFEKGTVQRHTKRGWNRGRMPVAPEPQRMIVKVIRIRRRMVEALIALVRRSGFEVPSV